MTLLGLVEEKVYCWYEGEHRQGHLEESKVYTAGRLNGAIWERERDGRAGTKSRRLQPRGKKGMGAKTADVMGRGMPVGRTL